MVGVATGRRLKAKIELCGAETGEIEKETKR